MRNIRKASSPAVRYYGGVSSAQRSIITVFNPSCKLWARARQFNVVNIGETHRPPIAYLMPQHASAMECRRIAGYLERWRGQSAGEGIHPKPMNIGAILYVIKRHKCHGNIARNTRQRNLINSPAASDWNLWCFATKYCLLIVTASK